MSLPENFIFENIIYFTNFSHLFRLLMLQGRLEKEKSIFRFMVILLEAIPFSSVHLSERSWTMPLSTIQSQIVRTFIFVIIAKQK